VPQVIDAKGDKGDCQREDLSRKLTGPSIAPVFAASRSTTE
jgi:hypothetical protein